MKPTTTGMGRYLRILNKINIPFSGHKRDWAGRPGRRPGGFEEGVSKVLRIFSCRTPCDEIPVFTGMTELEYGAYLISPAKTVIHWIVIQVVSTL